MTVCLFSCDLLFITHYLYSKTAFCKYSGMMKHYLLLVSQMWVTIICFDLAMTMHSSISTTNRNKIKTFLKYLIIASLIPLIFVVLLITLDSIGYLNARYADICWIKDFKTRLWFYIIPTAILFLLAIAALLSAFAKIYQTKKDTDKTLGSNKCNVDLVKIAAKLLIGLGFMEILGYVQVPGNISINSILSIIYVAVRSLKGVFICVLFLFNKNVWRLYTRRFASGKNRENTTRTTSINTIEISL